MEPDFKLSVVLWGLASVMPTLMALEFFSDSAAQAGPLYIVVVFLMWCGFMWIWWRAFRWMLHCWFTTMPTFGDMVRTIRSLWWNWIRPDRKWD